MGRVRNGQESCLHVRRGTENCVTGSRLHFGRMIFIALGDFRQNASVVRGGGKTATILASVRTLPSWDMFRIEGLTERVRDAEDPDSSMYSLNPSKDQLTRLSNL